MWERKPCGPSQQINHYLPDQRRCCLWGNHLGWPRVAATQILHALLSNLSCACTNVLVAQSLLTCECLRAFGAAWVCRSDCFCVSVPPSCLLSTFQLSLLPILQSLAAFIFIPVKRFMFCLCKCFPWHILNCVSWCLGDVNYPWHLKLHFVMGIPTLLVPPGRNSLSPLYP